MSNTLLQRIQQHQYLMDLRHRLLHLHKMLLEMERITYEQVQGRVTSRELLQLAIEHEQFSWLHRLSELIVQIDDLLRADEPILADDVQDLTTEVRELLTPSESGNVFARKYDAALQQKPDVVLAHADVTALLANG